MTEQPNESSPASIVLKIDSYMGDLPDGVAKLYLGTGGKDRYRGLIRMLEKNFDGEEAGKYTTKNPGRVNQGLFQELKKFLADVHCENPHQTTQQIFNELRHNLGLGLIEFADKTTAVSSLSGNR